MHLFTRFIYDHLLNKNLDVELNLVYSEGSILSIALKRGTCWWTRNGKPVRGQLWSKKHSQPLSKWLNKIQIFRIEMWKVGSFFLSVEIYIVVYHIAIGLFIVVSDDIFLFPSSILISALCVNCLNSIPEYSRIIESGCASGVDYFRNFTKLKNLNF